MSRVSNSPLPEVPPQPAVLRAVTPVVLAAPPLDGVEAARLISAIAAEGDRRAFARLFAFYAPRLKTMLSRQGFNAADCDDIVQDTMLAVWHKAGQFDASAGAVSTWIFTICRNLGIDRRRRTARRLLIDELPPIDDVDPAPSAEGELITIEEETRVRGALARLPAEQAEVISLSFFAQSPQTEIARRLGIPLGTVKSRVRLAMNRLRQLLDDPT